MNDSERTATIPVCISISSGSLEHYHERNEWEEQLMADSFGRLPQVEEIQDSEDLKTQKDQRAPHTPQLRITTSSSFDTSDRFAQHEYEQELSSPSSIRTEASDNIVIRVRSVRDMMYERFPEMTMEFENFEIPDDRERLRWLIIQTDLDIPPTIDEEDEEEEELANDSVEDTESSLDDTETDQDSFQSFHSGPKELEVPWEKIEIIHETITPLSDYNGISPSSLARRLSVVKQQRSSLSGKLESIWPRRHRSRTGIYSGSNSDSSICVSNLHKTEGQPGISAKRWSRLFGRLKFGKSRK
ncbi:hypothetical protein ACMFMF_008024 [Clarireedia jacksonii]